MPPRARKLSRQPPPEPAAGGSRALVVIDYRRLHAAAWAELHSAKKRLEKSVRDLHQHENVDLPAFDQWIAQTFPVELTQDREMRAEIETKSRRIEAVHAQAAYYGGSPKRIWREQKEREANPELFPDAESESGEARRPRSAPDDPFSDDEGAEWSDDPFGNLFSSPRVRQSPNAREIYRRLVQRLHPDRGGTWTAERERVWHEVQEAWAANDADWLARLEVEWETANEVLGPTSPLSRIRRAIQEMTAAWRDVRRKLAAYREAPAWRFTKTRSRRAALEESMREMFRLDLAQLTARLAYLNRTIAAWEDDWTRSDVRLRPRPRRRRMS